MTLAIAQGAPVFPAVPGVMPQGQTVAHVEPVDRPTVLYVSGSPLNRPGTSICIALATNKLIVLLGVTSSGAFYESAIGRSAGEYVHELRRLSGLTWDQLAAIFSVTRRAVHMWASDKPMTLEHEVKLHRLCYSLHKIDRGEARLNRSALLSVHSDGKTVVDLMKEGRLEEVEAFLGRGSARPYPEAAPLSPSARAARRPPRPADLMVARQDVVHREDGRLVRVSPRRLPPSK